MRRTSWIYILLMAVNGTGLGAGTPPDQPDFSSPDKTWITICTALKERNLAGFRAGFHSTNEISQLFTAAYTDTTVTTFQLANAVALLGSDGKQLSAKLEQSYTDLVENGRNRRTEISGDTAKWIRTQTTDKGKTEQVMYFKKVQERWLIDTERSYALDAAEGRKAAEDFVDNSKKQLPLLKKMIADILANKIKTVDELRRRLAE